LGYYHLLLKFKHKEVKIMLLGKFVKLL